MTLCMKKMLLLQVHLPKQSFELPFCVEFLNFNVTSAKQKYLKETLFNSCEWVVKLERQKHDFENFVALFSNLWRTHCAIVKSQTLN